MEVRSGVDIIEKMSRDVFRQKFVKGVCKTRSFGALFSLKAENISVVEKQEVRTTLAGVGIPLSLTESDEELNMLAQAISARAVSLR